MDIPNTETTPGGAADTEITPTGGDQGQPVAAQPTEYELDGQKLSADQIREAIKAARDYQSFQPEFTRRSQLISRLQKEGVIDEQGNVVSREPAQDSSKEDPFANNPQAKEAVKILKQMGFTTQDAVDKVIADMRKELEGFKSSYQSEIEDRQLNNVAANLGSKYDGKKGEPKFDLGVIRTAVQKDPALISYVQDPTTGQYMVDLEQTYRNVHADFWNKIPDIRAKVTKTERGSQVQSTTPATSKKAESFEERRDEAQKFFQNSTQGE